MKEIQQMNPLNQPEKNVMEFSSQDGGPQKPNDSSGKKAKNANPNNKGYLRLILVALCFILVVSLLLYFFVFNNSNNTRVFSDNDITYNVDYDGDGKYDNIADYNPETHGDFRDVVVNEGSLAKILLNATDDSQDATRPYKNVRLSVVLSNQNSKMVYLNGDFVYAPKVAEKAQVYNFRAAIPYEYYETYVLPITRNVRVPSKGTDGTPIVKLYYNPNNYAYSIETSSSVSSWLFPLILLVVMILVMYFFYSKMMKGVGGGGGNPMAGFVNNVARKSEGSKVRFSDVAGCDEAKAELVEMVDYFHATDKYTRLGAKLPHGVLLVGPPGTGKTLLAKAVAGEANVPFFSISGSDFVEMYVGVGASRVRSLFKSAKQNAPCLIFIDEIDAVGRQRGAGLGGGNDEREQTLNELLVEMDGFEDNNGIIVMAATNRSDVLDPALTRPGRFDRTITVDLPDVKGRAAILKVHAKNKKLASDVSFDSIASRTVGFSGADLANIMNDAAILAVRANRNAITTADIDEAIDRAIAGPAKKSHLEPEEKKQVAYHEAGHAVVGLFLPYSDKVQKITIVPRGRTGGHVLMTPEKDRFLMTKNQLLARITGYLGGRTSEEIFFGDVSTGASNDIEVATNIARSMVTEYGMSDLGPIQYEKPGGSVFLGRDYGSTQANYSTQIAFEIDKAIRCIVESCHDQCRKLLEEHKEDVILIAETLIKNETITADQISYLLKNRKLPEVDEHKITDHDSLVLNPNDIILYPGYQKFYRELDRILEQKPSCVVLTVAKDGAPAVADEKFREYCATKTVDPKRVGLMFVDTNNMKEVSMSIESFAEHLESYVGVPLLLLKTDEATVKNLEGKYCLKPAEPKAEPAKRKGVVNEILPALNNEKKEENTETPTTPSDEDNQKEEQKPSDDSHPEE